MTDHQRPVSQMLYLRAKGKYTVGIDLSKCNNHLKILQTGETLAVCSQPKDHAGQHIDTAANIAWEGSNNVNKST